MIQHTGPKRHSKRSSTSRGLATLLNYTGPKRQCEGHYCVKGFTTLLNYTGPKPQSFESVINANGITQRIFRCKVARVNVIGRFLHDTLQPRLLFNTMPQSALLGLNTMRCLSHSSVTQYGVIHTETDLGPVWVQYITWWWKNQIFSFLNVKVQYGFALPSSCDSRHLSPLRKQKEYKFEFFTHLNKFNLTPDPSLSSKVGKM